LLWRVARAGGEGSERAVHLGFRDLDPVALGDLQLQLLVDELIDHLLARRHFVRRELYQLGALGDIDGGHRVAIDDDNHLLRQ
jgi:hypothetical protein